jgi:hypothetical protein
MLWTVMPLETVLAGHETYRPSYREISWKNATLLVEEAGRDTARVIRLLSTDPLHYLDPQVQPGTIIRYQAESQAARS